MGNKKMKIAELKRRKQNRFLKEAQELANAYSQKMNYHLSNLITRYTKDLYQLAEKYLDEEENLSQKTNNAKHLNNSIRKK